jgi:hypothetical protein
MRPSLFWFQNLSEDHNILVIADSKSAEVDSYFFELNSRGSYE